MTRNKLIAIGNEIERAVISIDRNPMLALMYVREAHRVLGIMLAPHDTGGIAGIVVKDNDTTDPHNMVPAIMAATAELNKQSHGADAE